jgi:electron transfer flavoprotein beta subunit
VGAAAAKVTVAALEMPIARQAGITVPGDTAGKAKELVRLLHEEAKVI